MTLTVFQANMKAPRSRSCKWVAKSSKKALGASMESSGELARYTAGSEAKCLAGSKPRTIAA